MVALNRAVALAMVNGPAAGLAALAALEEDGRLAEHYRLDAVRAHFLEMAGDTKAAIQHYPRGGGAHREPPRTQLSAHESGAAGGGWRRADQFLAFLTFLRAGGFAARRRRSPSRVAPAGPRPASRPAAVDSHLPVTQHFLRPADELGAHRRRRICGRPRRVRASRLDPEILQSGEHRLHRGVGIAIERAAAHPDETPTKALEDLLAHHVVLERFARVVAIAVALDREPPVAIGAPTTRSIR